MLESLFIVLSENDTLCGLFLLFPEIYVNEKEAEKKLKFKKNVTHRERIKMKIENF